MRDAAGRAGGTGILVGQIAKAAAEGAVEDFVEGGVLVGTRREIAVSPGDGYFVPSADAFGISFGEIDRAIGFEFHVRWRVIHNRRAIDGAGRVVVH